MESIATGRVNVQGGLLGSHGTAIFMRQRYFSFLLLIVTASLVFCSGCTMLPELTHQPQFHNPFPQLQRVAVLPFVNQSADPTLSGAEIANLYRAELQEIPGFEVMPLGVVEQALRRRNFDVGQLDFQQLARTLDVDAVVIGSVTDFDPYYPPRMGLAISWYAANPGFHPIPPGYGLPWGTADEEFIPNSLVFEAEFALAREQLETQTPQVEPDAGPISVDELEDEQPRDLGIAGLPSDWPDPSGFIPPGPQAEKPEFVPQSRPVMQLVRQYDGADADFTAKLETYHYFREDARIGGWEAILRRKRDFMQFCCYLHITEMLAARGGGSETRLVLKWPIGR